MKRIDTDVFTFMDNFIWLILGIISAIGGIMIIILSTNLWSNSHDLIFVDILVKIVSVLCMMFGIGFLILAAMLIYLYFYDKRVNSYKKKNEKNNNSEEENVIEEKE